MSDGTITRFELDPDNSPRLSDEERARLDAMTEEEVHAAALANPDNPPLTDEELQRLERVPNLEAIREKLGLTQKEFAATFQLSLSAVRDWEQERFVPDRAARTLLKVIAHNPEAVKEALARQP
jgi:putative transcriptional regulator